MRTERNRAHQTVKHIHGFSEVRSISSSDNETWESGIVSSNPKRLRSWNRKHTVSMAFLCHCNPLTQFVGGGGLLLPTCVFLCLLLQFPNLIGSQSPTVFLVCFEDRDFIGWIFSLDFINRRIHVGQLLRYWPACNFSVIECLAIIRLYNYLTKSRIVSGPLVHQHFENDGCVPGPRVLGGEFRLHMPAL